MDNIPTQKEVRETLVQSIIRIGEAVVKLEESGLNKNAIVTLVARDTGIARKYIHSVLTSLQHLQILYTNEKDG